MSTDELFLPTIVDIVAIFLMLFGNTNIVVATIRNKSLQHPCNFLIAFNALADNFSQFGTCVFAYYLFSGILYTTKLTCVYLQSVSIFGSMFGLAITLAIGIDRMIGVVTPLRYHQLKTPYHVFSSVFLSIIYASTYTYANFQDNLSTSNDTVICFVSNIVHPNIIVAKNIGQGICCGSILIAYSITWLFMFMKKSDNLLKQTLIPLTIIMCMVVFTWPLTILLVGLIRQFIQPDKMLVATLYMTWITNFGRASNYFIFFNFSKDYRKTFLQQLLWVPYFGKFAGPQTTSVIKIEQRKK